jgi:hypothetical protein
MENLTINATKWVKFNSISGRVSAKQVERVVKQFKSMPDILERMIKERNL